MKFSPVYYVIFPLQTKAIWWTFLSIGVGILITQILQTNLHGIIAPSFAIIFLIAIRGFKEDIIQNYRKNRFRYPIKIGILTATIPDNAWEGRALAGGFTTPVNWHHFFNNHNPDILLYNTVLISPAEIDDSFAIILNPYGERYLEEDLARRATFHKIKEFIRKGGIFVNTAGLAFFYMIDVRTGLDFMTGESLEAVVPRARVSRDTQEIQIVGLDVYAQDEQTNFLNSWLRENFGLRTTIGIETEANVFQLEMDRRLIENITNIGGTDRVMEFRSALYSKNLIPFLRAWRRAGAGQYECYPLAAVKFGLGYLVLAGFRPDNAWFLKIGTATVNLINSVTRLGTLDANLDIRDTLTLTFSDV